MERVEARVHQLPPREQVPRRAELSATTAARVADDQRLVPRRRGRAGRRRGQGSPPDSEVSTTEHAMTMVSQLSQAKLPDATSHSWVTMMTAAATLAAGCGAKQHQRHDELRDVVAGHLDPVQRVGQMMEEPAQRPGHRLGLVVVAQAGEVPPAPVAAQLDQAGAELEPQQQPAQQPQQRGGRRAAARCRGRPRGTRSPAAAIPSRSRTRPGRRSRSTGTAPTAPARPAWRPTAVSRRRARPPSRPPAPRPSRRRTRTAGPNSEGGTGSACARRSRRRR